ncbi:MAG: hypothetical protein IBX63_10140 [Coriobacteriia bacterium]|nr:hypothetical protein [Coriobacteriia bacterium]
MPDVSPSRELDVSPSREAGEVEAETLARLLAAFRAAAGLETSEPTNVAEHEETQKRREAELLAALERAVRALLTGDER